MSSRRSDEIDRLLAGDVVGDPAAESVSKFLNQLEQSCPAPSVTGVQERHLALVAAAVREQAVGDRDRQRAPLARRRLRRGAATAITAVLGVLTAGIGVAAALGVNPLPAMLPDLVAHRTASPSAPPGLARQESSPPAEPPQGKPSTRPSQPGRPQTVPPVPLPSQATGPKERGKGQDQGRGGEVKGRGGENGKGEDNRGRPESPGKPTERGRAGERPAPEPTRPSGGAAGPDSGEATSGSGK